MSDILVLPGPIQSIAPSSQLGSAPATNLLDPRPGRPWQSLGTTDNLTIDLGQDRSVDTIWLGYTNLTTAATWEIRGASAAQGASYLNNAGSVLQAPTQAWASADALGPRYHALWWRDSGPIGLRHLRISVFDAANPDGVLRAGRLYVSQAFRPAWPREAGSERGVIDLSIKERLRSGPLVITKGAKVKTRSVSFTGASAEDVRQFFWPLLLQRGESEDLLAIMDPTPALGRHELIVYGVLARTRAIEIAQANYQSVRLEIEEMP